MKYLYEREQIVETARRLHKAGCLSSCDGNISIKVDRDTILITPAGRPKAFITKKEIALMDLEGTPKEGHPSGEKHLHLTVYRTVKKAGAVIHAHPPCATAWSIARPDLKELPCESCAELILSLGGVPIAPYARPGTKAMGESIKKYLPQSKVMILSRHGSLTWSEDIDTAYFAQERLEHSAKMLMYAVSINNKLSPLPKTELQALKQLRKKIGDKIL